MILLNDFFTSVSIEEFTTFWRISQAIRFLLLRNEIMLADKSTFI